MRSLQKLDISFNNIATLEALDGVRNCLQHLTSLHALDNPVAQLDEFVARMVSYAPWLIECNGAFELDCIDEPFCSDRAAI